MRSPINVALKLAVVWVAGSLVVFEGVLQGFSWIEHVKLTDHYEEQLSPDTRLNGNRRVLCLGDSFTFGVGASSRDMSYPRQLESLLSAKDASGQWKVLNFGKPGMTSWEIRRDIARMVQLAQPAYVCLLAGMNDEWHRQPPIAWDTAAALNDEPVTPRSFQWLWKYRTGTLLHLLTQRLRNNPQSPEEYSRADLAGERQPRVDASRSVHADGMPLSQRTTEDLRALGDRVLWDGRDLKSAVKIYETLRSRDLDDPWASLKLARVLQRLWKDEAALAIADALSRERWQGNPLSPDESLMRAKLYQQAGDRVTAREIAQATLRMVPQHAGLLELLARVEIREGNYMQAAEYLNAAIAIAPKNPHSYLRRAFLATREGAGLDLDQAYKDVLMYYALSGDKNPTAVLRKLNLVYSSHPISVKQLEQWIQELRLSSADAQAIIQIFNDLRRDGERDHKRLVSANLEAIYLELKSQGVRVIFLNYPNGVSVNAVQRSVADTHAIPFIDAQGHLERLREVDGLPYDHFLFKDGHANDLGYGAMARLVADRILEFESP